MTDVFDQDTKTTPIVTASTSPFDDKLKEIVNDQGQPKYKDVPSALEALKASQEHIKQLERENPIRDAEILRLREEVKQKEALEDIVARLQTNKDAGTQQTPAITSLSEDTIVKTLESVLDKRDLVKVAQANVDSVTNTLTAKYGEKTKEVVATKAAELGMTPKQLGELSSNNPKLVLSLFGEKAPPPSNPTTPSVSTPLVGNSDEIILKRPEKSLLVGAAANDKNRAALMAEIKKKVHKQFDVEAA